jgi:PadR family transcriptional regulator PadR
LSRATGSALQWNESDDSLREKSWPSSLTEVIGLAESIQTQLRKGVLELCVLTLLSRADSYGYEIATRLMQEVGMGEGTIYPLMRRMQDDGQVSTYLMEAPGGPPRKYYRITETGRATLKAQRQEWKSFITSVEKMLGETP